MKQVKFGMRFQQLMLHLFSFSNTMLSSMHCIHICISSKTFQPNSAVVLNKMHISLCIQRGLRSNKLREGLKKQYRYLGDQHANGMQPLCCLLLYRCRTGVYLHMHVVSMGSGAQPGLHMHMQLPTVFTHFPLGQTPCSWHSSKSVNTHKKWKTIKSRDQIISCCCLQKCHNFPRLLKRRGPARSETLQHFCSMSCFQNELQILFSVRT